MLINFIETEWYRSFIGMHGSERLCIADAIRMLAEGGNFLEIGTAVGVILKEIKNCR